MSSESNFILLHVVSTLTTLVKNQLTTYVRVYFMTINSITLIYMSMLVPAPHCLDFCCFVLTLKSGYVSPPTLFFFFKIVLATLGPLQFCMNFRINMSISTKKAAELLTEIVLSM